jgi:hypothetical protein
MKLVDRKPLGSIVWFFALRFLGGGRSRRTDRRRLELEIGADVAHLDLDGLPLVAGVVLPRALYELAGHEDPHALAKRAARVLGDAAPCRAAEETVVTSCHCPLCLERWLTATVKPLRAAPLWV